MSRRLRRLSCTALLATAAVGCSGSPPAQPDIVLIVVDTLRADFLGTYGSPFGASPNVDRLASESVVFERAIAAAPSTVPSVATLLTSSYVREHTVGPVTGDTQLAEVATLASTLRDAGYATAAFVSNFVLRRDWGFDRGFDVYDAELTERELHRPVVERIAENTTVRALHWLSGVGDEPFFLWVHYQDPHGPYMAPSSFRGAFDIPPREGDARLPLLAGNSGLRGIPAYQVLPELDRPSQYRSRYADEVGYADYWIGQLVAAIEDAQRARPVVVMLTADHGEGLGENERYFVHGFTTTPEVAHVPMILRAPDVPPGRRSEIVSHVDVMPTLLELAGVAPPAQASGIALGPLLRAQRPIPGRTVYCDNGNELSAYRADGFTRVIGAGGTSAGSTAGPSELSSTEYAWRSDGSWTPLSAGNPPSNEIRSYIGSGVPLKRRTLDAQTRARLRALGYLEPE